MDLVTGAVIIVGLQKVGGPAAEVVKDFLGKILAPTGSALGKSLAHPIVEWQKRRVARAGKLVEEAAEIVAASGQEPCPVPGRLLMPILERGSLEEDPELRDRWVALLANAAMNSTAITPAFVSILGELSSAEARVLKRLDEVQAEQKYLRISEHEDDAGAFRRLSNLDEEVAFGRVKEFAGVDSDFDFELIVANLQRLSLVRAITMATRDEVHALRLTRLGRALIAACTTERRR